MCLEIKVQRTGFNVMSQEHIVLCIVMASVTWKNELTVIVFCAKN